MKCCFKKPNGNLCVELHKSGFVVKLKDETISLVGNKCAKDKFGADARIKVDRSKYLNEKRRREQFIQLGRLLADKSQRLVTLDALKERTKSVQHRIEEFLASLGERTARRIGDMARSGNTGVIVEAITYKLYKDENCNEKKERHVDPTRLGVFNGISVINQHSFASIYDSVRTINAAYEKASTLNDEHIKTSQLELITATLSRFDVLVQNIERLEQDEQAFFNSDLSLLCYLVDDKVERYKAARVVLERIGESASKDKAKVWLAEKDQTLKIALKAQKIDIR